MAEVPTFLAPRAALREEGTDGGRTGDVHGEGDAVAIRLLAPRARFTLRIEPPLLTRAKGTAGFMLAADQLLPRRRRPDGHAPRPR